MTGKDLRQGGVSIVVTSVVESGETRWERVHRLGETTWRPASSVQRPVLTDRRCAVGRESPRLRWPVALALVLAVGVTASCSSARVALPGASDQVTVAPLTPSTSPLDPVDPAETGVPDGIQLRPSGPLRITEDGAVVDGLDVEGCVVVDAVDVVIRNTRITCDDADRTLAVQVEDGATGLVVEHSEIDGSGVVEVGVGWTGYTLRYVDIHGVNDGARFGHGVLIEDSWIHDMARIGELHPDALQTTSASNVVIRRNVLDPVDGDGDLNNAAIMLGSETGTEKVVDVLIEHNLLDGGNYSLNIRGDIDAEDVVIRDNTFGDDTRYGEVLAPSSVPLGAGNVTASGGAVDPDTAKSS